MSLLGPTGPEGFPGVHWGGRIRSVSPLSPAEKIFGAMLAGGKSRRFGRSKVFTPLAGAPLASWGVRALQSAGLPVGVVSDEEGVEAVLGVPARARSGG